MGILDKNKSKHGRLHRRVGMTLTAFVAAVSMAFAPAAMADMQGIDVSNWQCGIDIANTQADFVVVGTTWGTGQVYNNCLVSGVNTDANRMIAQAQASGKKFGLYHYAMGGNPEAEAQFFYRNTSNYWRHGIVALDWEMDDNPAWGTGTGYAASWRNANGCRVVCAHCCTPARSPAPSRRTSATGTVCGSPSMPT